MLACSDSDLRKAGAPGRFILDDPAIYPSKEDVGFLRKCRRQQEQGVREREEGRAGRGKRGGKRKAWTREASKEEHG